MNDFIAYYRVSTRAQSRSGLGLEAQRDVVRKFIETSGTLIGEFTDVESGRKDSRKQLEQAMKQAKTAKASIVIARLDRFSRRVSFIASMMESGIPLVIAEMPNATEFQLHIFAALAQEERRLISVRTKAALAQAKKRGVQLGINGKRLARENKVAAVKFAKQIEPELPAGWRNQSYSEIARSLNAKGIRSFTGKRFFPQTVKAIEQKLDAM